MKSTKILCIAALLAIGTPTAGTALAAETFEVDAAHSSVVFRAKHLGVSYAYGRFNDISGSFSFDDATLDIEIKTDSIDTNSKDRDKHLKGPDFFNVKQFPVAKFSAKEFTKRGDNVYKVTGDMAFHGVTKSLDVTLERVGSGEDPWGGYRSGFEVIFNFKRSDFGMTYGTKGLGDDIRVMVSVEGVRK